MANQTSKIPNGWESTTLGDLIDIKHGYAFSGKGITDDPTDNILLTPGNFLIGGGWKDGKKYYNGNIPEDYILRKGDLIVTMTDLSKDADTLGYPALIPNNSTKNFLHNQRIGLVAVNEKVASKKYIYYLLRFSDYQRYVVNSATGSTVRHTSPTRIRSFEFPKPQVPEQHAIAAVLSPIDEKIELLCEQNKILEKIAQYIFNEWFVNFNFPESTGKKIDSALGEIPEGWNVGKMDQVVSIRGGTTPSTQNKTYWDGDIYWTSPKDLSNNKAMYLLNTEKKITKEGLKQISSGLLPINTLLLYSRAPIGYLAITNISVAINQGYIAFLPNQYFSNYYMYLWLKANMQTVKGVSNGSTFMEVSKSSFRSIDCVIPTKDILNTFDKTVGPLFNKILNNTMQIKTLKKSLNMLLPKLLRGEIRVKGFDN